MSIHYEKSRTLLTQERVVKRSTPADVERECSPFAFTVENLEAWSIGNWLQIPEPERRLLLDHLRTTMCNAEGGRAHLARWTAQVREGVPIGANDTWFHFGVGMVVRNLLRDVMTDDKLPPIRQPDGSMGQNYDDFYRGAIHALVTEPPGDMAFTDTVEVSDSGKVTVGRDHRLKFIKSDEQQRSFNLIADEPVFHFLDWLAHEGFEIVPVVAP